MQLTRDVTQWGVMAGVELPVMRSGGAGGEAPFVEDTAVGTPALSQRLGNNSRGESLLGASMGQTR